MNKRAVGVLFGLLVAGLLLAGCAPSNCTPSKSKGPVLEGDIQLCLLWERPVPRQGEIGSSGSMTFTSGRIQIYEHFICVVETKGMKHVAPHDSFSNVHFK